MPAWENVGNIKGPPGPPGPPGDVQTVVSRGNFFFGSQNDDGIPAAKLPGYWKAKFNGTIEGWDITVDAGTIQIAIWKIANGDTAPTAADAIGAIELPSGFGTSRESIDLSGFTTLDVFEGDIFAAAVLLSSGCKDVGGSIWIRKLGDAVSGGGGINLVTNETPAGAINDANTLFTTANSFTDLDVYLNGLRQRLGVDYTVTSSNAFTMATPPSAGDTLTVDYLT